MLFAVKNTALSSVYAMKKKAYCAVCPQLVGIAKQATRATEQPIYGHNKEYKRKSAAWFNPFHLRIRNKYVDSVHNY